MIKLKNTKQKAVTRIAWNMIRKKSKDAYKGLLNFNSHILEHNAGIVNGITLVVTGIITFFVH